MRGLGDEGAKKLIRWVLEGEEGEKEGEGGLFRGGFEGSSVPRAVVVKLIDFTQGAVKSCRHD